MPGRRGRGGGYAGQVRRNCRVRRQFRTKKFLGSGGFDAGQARPGYAGQLGPRSHSQKKKRAAVLPPREDCDFALPPRSELRLRFFAEKPITGPAPKVREICCPRSITPGVFFPSPGQRRRSVSEAVLAASLTECFFTTHTLPSILAWQQDCPCQSWRGNRIALVNPGVATGLPLQSCCGNRIASPNPALTTGMPRCITSSLGLELESAPL